MNLTKNVNLQPSKWKNPLILLLSFISIFSAVFLISKEKLNAHRNTILENISQSTSSKIYERLQGNENYIKLLTLERIENKLNFERFQEIASSYVKKHPELINFTWVNANSVIETVAPLKGNEQIIGLSLNLPEPKRASEEAKRTHKAVYTKAFEAIQGNPSYEIWYPVYRGEEFLGFFAGVYSCKKTKELLYEFGTVKDIYNISLYDQDNNSILPTTKNYFDYQLKTQVPLVQNFEHIFIHYSIPSDRYTWILIILSFLFIALFFTMFYSIAMLKKEIEQRKVIEVELVNSQQLIEDSNRQLQLLNENLEHSVKERTIELEIAKNKLENALESEREINQINSNFLSIASHEFRTPLTTILSSINLLQHYKLTEQQSKRDKHILRIKQSIQNLNDILQDLLTVEQLKEGKFQPDNTIIDLKTTLSSFLNELSVLKKVGQTLHFKYLGPELSIYTDPKILRHVIFNLISNALKYSPENSPVTLLAKLDEEHLYVEIIDRGIGIPLQEQANLFTRFFRASNAKSIQGTGLGLSIVHSYLQQINAQITFKSNELGTTFHLDIPIKVASMASY